MTTPMVQCQVNGFPVLMPVGEVHSIWAIREWVEGLRAAGFEPASVGGSSEPGGHKDGGEQEETVSHVLRGKFTKDGKTTPYVLLYAENKALKHSFLKVYLNTEQDILLFQQASGVLLNNLPVYIGKDKPERGSDPDIDQLIIAVANPFKVVVKQNPYWSQEAADAAKSRNEIYAKPRRVLVRWVGPSGSPPAPQAANPQQPQRAVSPHPPAPSRTPDWNAIRDEARHMLANETPLAEFNRMFGSGGRILDREGAWLPYVPADARTAIMEKVVAYANARNWFFNGTEYEVSTAMAESSPF